MQSQRASSRTDSRYDEIDEIDVVESDDMFVEVCRKFFPETAKGFEDARVKIYYEDGLRFLRGKINESPEFRGFKNINPLVIALSAV